MKLAGLFAGLLAFDITGVLADDLANRRTVECLTSKNVSAMYTDSPKFAELAEPFNLRLQYKPSAIVLPKTARHIQDAVICAAQCQLKVQAKSGGHSYASFSSGGQDGSMVIDLQSMQNIELDQGSGIARVGGGVRIGNLAQGVWDQGMRAVPHGTCPGVGVGGQFTHGGYGHTSRHWGLGLDTIVGAEVVLADGSIVAADQNTHPEIFWAIRGAADSFGIIVNFYIQTQPAPESITYFSFKWEGMYNDRDTYINTFQHIQDFAKNESVIDDKISWGTYTDGTVYNVGGAYLGSVDEFISKIQPEFLRGLPTPKEITVQKYGWIEYLKLVSDKNEIMEPLAGYDEHDNFFAKSITVPEEKGLSRAAIGAMYDYIKQGSPTKFFVITNLYGGPGSSINSKDTDFAAYADRDSLWVLQLYGFKENDGNASVPFINGLTNAMIQAQPDTHFGAYLNYVDPTYTAQAAHHLYYGEELHDKLRELKKQVDPMNVFWHPQAIVA